MYLQTLSFPAGSPGTHNTLSVWHYGTPGRGKKIYIQAALHADEWPGILVLHHLHPLLNQAEICGEIVIVPYANPIGLRQFLGGYQLGRFDFDYSGNFNRGYLNLAEAATPFLNVQTLRRQTFSERVIAVRAAFAAALAQWQPALESGQLRKTLQQLSFDADVVLDLHCDACACTHVFANKRHHTTAEILAEVLDAPVLLLEDEPAGLAFDDANAGAWWRLAEILNIDLPCPSFAATVELRGERDINDAQSKKDALALFRWFEHLGIITGAATSVSPRRRRATPLSGVARLLAPRAGLIVHHAQPGDKVKAGQTVAELLAIDNPNCPRLPLVAPTEGIIYALGRNHLVRPGHVVTQIAGKKPLGKGTLAF